MPRKFSTGKKCLIGVISDTHGKLPRSIKDVFKGADLIIHAGDVGDPEILKVLQKIAPTVAVRGNMDMGKWAHQLQQNEVIRINETLLCVLHDTHHLDLNPELAQCHAVVYGHTHRPQVQKKNGVLYLNPGSASQPRYGYPPSVALVQIKDNSIHARLIKLK